MTTAKGEPKRWLDYVALFHNSDECLIFPYAKQSNGYGNVLIGGKNTLAHRYICELVHGPAPTRDHQAAHRREDGSACISKACVNGRHLRWDLQIGNSADSISHGVQPRGERHGRGKLTTQDVLAIKAAKGSAREIGAEYGVSEFQVYRIRGGRSWSHLPTIGASHG